MSSKAIKSGNKGRVERIRRWLPSVEPDFVDPPIKNLQPTRITSYGGQLLVRQTKRSERWRERSLASIKLGKIGRASVVPDVWSHPQTGQARAVRHLCRVALLPAYVPAGDVLVEVRNGVMFATNSTEAGMSTFHEGLNTIYENYGDTWGSGETIVVGDGEYLQVESTSERITISWTSNTSLQDLYRIIEKEPNKFRETGASETFVQIRTDKGDVEWAEGTTSEVWSFIDDEDPDVVYASFQYELATIAWTPRGNRVPSSDALYTEIAIVLRKLDRAIVTSLILQTASMAVRDHYRELFSDIKQLASA